MRALVYGGSGGLAQSLVRALDEAGWTTDVVTRRTGKQAAASRHQVNALYSEYAPAIPPDAVFFPQALFAKKPLTATSDTEIEQSLMIGLTDLIKTVRNLLAADPDPERRVDYAFIGSTSAYAGFAQTAVYCAVKHGLLGLVRALNDEYAKTGKRFWLFSMGTMDTSMGRMLTDQDPTSFLSPEAVAERIIRTVSAADNLFEPEVIIRRRSIRFKEV